MTQDQQEQDAQAHQQGHPDGDSVSCLHCVLHTTVLKWIEETNAAGGAPIERTGYQLGQFVCEAVNNFRATLPPDEDESFVDFFNQAQKNTAAILAGQTHNPTTH